MPELCAMGLGQAGPTCCHHVQLETQVRAMCYEAASTHCCHVWLGTWMGPWELFTMVLGQAGLGRCCHLRPETQAELWELCAMGLGRAGLTRYHHVQPETWAKAACYGTRQGWPCKLPPYEAGDSGGNMGAACYRTGSGWSCSLPPHAPGDLGGEHGS